MAEPIDEARIIAWIDGELAPAEAAEIESVVAQDAALTALADRHRRLKARFASAFGPLAAESAEIRPSAAVISLAEARAERDARAALASRPASVSRWGWPTAVAASLLLGILVGHQAHAPAGLADRVGALALNQPIATALDTQLSGDAGPIRIALSFHDQKGGYCRSFTGTSLSGVACRTGSAWTLRYGAPGQTATSAYRTAGIDSEMMSAIDAMIAGSPLDRAQEARARDTKWHSTDRQAY